MSTELEKTDVKITGGLVQLQSMSEALTFCQEIFNSGLCPSSFKSKQAVFIALQTGGELGLSPMQSLQGLYAFNGRVAMMENCARGIAQHSGKLESIEDRFEGTGDDLTAICTVHRAGIKNTFIGRFSVADAKRAKLWDKEGPWKLYPKDMLKKKASARALRDAFGDVLIGLPIKEDIEDLPPEKREAVNLNPVHDPLIDALPDTIVDAEFTTENHDVSPSENLSKIPTVESTGGASAMRAAIQSMRDAIKPPVVREVDESVLNRDNAQPAQRGNTTTPCPNNLPTVALLNRHMAQAQGPKSIEGEIQRFVDSKNNPAKYFTIQMGGKWFGGAKSIGALCAARDEFEAKKRIYYRIYYTETPYESNGKSGMNNTIVGIEEI